ncbi:LacI family transcriptional regulator [Bifidobacterium aemilianum]|uniref:LacI family transcriptional regulator n=1 Tax=Bifidobacterium aemilianum TaxID=2493120 RepID=A0A366K6I1_9BIFI|nr:LacI family DNA-binding transcriptional regulator [Bifidobacterium aemilianum]RBP97346.1 LacI family transcriptional regulator [Bifidobacterium aemilianum]
MPGIKDVAQLAGVSASTVSYVLTGKRSISAKTTNKVMKAIDQLGYTPDARGQRLRGSRSQVIALSEPIREGMNQVQYSAYFMQAALQARKAGYDVLLLGAEDAVGDIRRVTNGNQADGVVLLDVMADDNRSAEAGSYTKPSVAIGYPHSHESCACIDIDFVALGKMAARKLDDFGHKRVVLLRGLEDNYARGAGYMLLFRASFLSNCEKLGIEVRESGKVTPDFDAEGFVRNLILGPKAPTAIVNQSQAGILNVVLDALGKARIRVPEDLSVISCGTFLQGEMIRYPVSEVPLDPGTLCRKVITVLVDAIENKRDIRGLVELTEPTYVDRGSLGPAPGDGKEIGQTL